MFCFSFSDAVRPAFDILERFSWEIFEDIKNNYREKQRLAVYFLNGLSSEFVKTPRDTFRNE